MEQGFHQQENRREPNLDASGNDFCNLQRIVKGLKISKPTDRYPLGVGRRSVALVAEAAEECGSNRAAARDGLILNSSRMRYPVFHVWRSYVRPNAVQIRKQGDRSVTGRRLSEERHHNHSELPCPRAR